MRLKQGFTLTEVMVVLAILAVMAGLAVPGYFNTIEQSRINEAITTINIIHMGEKIRRLSGTFWNGGNDPGVAAINTNLNVDISPTFYDNIDFSSTDTTTNYTVRVTRNNTMGGNTGWYQQYVFTNGAAAPVKSCIPASSCA